MPTPPRVRLDPRALLLCAVSAACACDGAPDGERAKLAGHADRPIVAVSVAPQRYFVERVAGDLVRVEVMLPPGASPTTYAPSFAQLRALESAKLYVRVGHPLFPFESAWLDRLLADRPGLRIIEGRCGEAAAQEADPHSWLSPTCALATARVTAEALGALMPEHAPAIAARLADFERETGELDAEIRGVLAGKAGARFLVFHPAWGYFARHYGLEQVAIEQGHKSPGVHELSALVEFARAAGFRHVIVQPQIDSTAARTIAAEIDASLVVADPLAADWADNLRRTARLLARIAVPASDARAGRGPAGT